MPFKGLGFWESRVSGSGLIEHSKIIFFFQNSTTKGGSKRVLSLGP